MHFGGIQVRAARLREPSNAPDQRLAAGPQQPGVGRVRSGRRQRAGGAASTLVSVSVSAGAAFVQAIVAVKLRHCLQRLLHKQRRVISIVARGSVWGRPLGSL